MSEVTAILLNYKHPENLARLIQVLKQQSHVPAIMIVDNSGHGIAGEQCITMPFNSGCYSRILLAPYVRTPWIGLIDDDSCPDDNEFIADALKLAKDAPTIITGAFGRELNWNSDKPYSQGDDAWGWVPVVKGRCMFFHRDLLNNIPIGSGMWQPHWDTGIYNEDVRICLAIEHGKAHHWSDKVLASRLVEIDTGDQLHNRQDHYDARDAYINNWRLYGEPGYSS